MFKVDEWNYFFGIAKTLTFFSSSLFRTRGGNVKVCRKSSEI